MIVCITFVVIGIVGAMKMEDHLTPRSSSAKTPANTPAETRAPLER
ncbi:hypothetical protein [Kineococcus rhizosphaerae]|uniref:Uncharacterized protein n=1 Tax=Kineococcus rhizosphaerae TaxID=559628 RepID=A0A2T0R1W5_9ACTN|nr:hypothetical protein [Kineococcus rhizosphaerae]PRY13505.1 hypothetical protein CLV37_108175 [Kineococcus rhizosphaerae]